MKVIKIKKTVFICIILALIIISVQNYIYSQNFNSSLPVPFIYDQNWNLATFFSDDFTGTRYWDNNRVDNTGKWIAYFSESGITHGSCEHQIYQRENALFNTPSAEFLTLRATYSPNTTNYWYPWYAPVTGSYNYISGAIETTQQFKYGYFELRAKLPPPNCGNFPAFWLWAHTSRGYSEIDIFEHIVNNEDHDSYKKVSGTNYWSIGDSIKSNSAGTYTLNSNELPLTEFHTYSIEWSPKMIIWYFDGKPYGSLLYDSRVADQLMALKVNYAIDDWKGKGDIIESCHDTTAFPLDMVIDYVKVYKLNCDCDTPVTITNNSELSAHSKSVKQKITVGSSSGTITVPSSGITLRATTEITINGDFEVPLGSEFYAITHSCPDNSGGQIISPKNSD